MKRKVSVVLCSVLLLMSGCAKKEKKSVNSHATAKPKASEKASESPEVSASAEAAETPEPQKTSEPAQNQNAENGNSSAAPVQTPASSTPAGTWQIVSYDDGSGNVQTFNPGQDDSIIGSSSIVLNADGSCEFNMPGMSSEGCTWSGNQINTNGTQIAYSINGTEMKVNDAGGTYVFQKAQ